MHRRSEVFIRRPGSTPLPSVRNGTIPIVHHHISLDTISSRRHCEEIEVEERCGVSGGACFDGECVGVPGHSWRLVEEHMRSDDCSIIYADSAGVVECCGRRAAVYAKA